MNHYIDKPVFILPSVSDRIEHLNRMIYSIRQSPYKDWAIAVYYQDNLNNAHLVEKRLLDHFIVVPERIGVGKARLNLLMEIPRYRYYGHIDDDMYLLPQTNYLPMLDFLDANPHVAHVMSKWARYEKAIPKLVMGMTHAFYKQILMYTGGGQWYRDDVSELYRKPYNIGKKDDETIWTLIAYLAGYENYVYAGSVALHKTLQKGGNRSHQQTQPNSEYVGFPGFIEYQFCRDGSWAIPMDKDVKPNARRIHKEQRANKFGTPKLILPELKWHA